MTEPDRPPRQTAANWILAGLIAAFGLVVFVVTVRDGRADSALLFVALPTTLAAALALLPGRTAHGRVFVVTTIALLLSAVALHEGAICVILAAPLVYAVSHGATALIRALRDTSRSYAVLAVPLLLLPGLEGSGLAPGSPPTSPSRWCGWWPCRPTRWPPGSPPAPVPHLSARCRCGCSACPPPAR